MKFRPYIHVSVRYNPELRKESLKFDTKLKEIASKFDGDSGDSGYGFGERDVSFTFYSIIDAKEFYTSVRRFKNVGVASSCVLNWDDCEDDCEDDY